MSPDVLGFSMGFWDFAMDLPWDFPTHDEKFHGNHDDLPMGFDGIHYDLVGSAMDFMGDCELASD